MQRNRSRSTGTAIVVVAAAAVALFLLLYEISAHAFVVDSDGATVALEGQAFAHGHLLLSGWTLPFDSFWTVDAPWYFVAVVLFGLHPILMHAVPAAIAAAVIVIGVFMAVEDRRGAAAVAAGGTVIAILALPSHALAFFFLRGPLHVGTALWCLVAFLALRRGRFGWGFVIAVVFLTAGLLGDLQMFALGVMPVFLCGLSAAGRTRDWREGLPQVAAAAASICLALVVREIASAIGAFSLARTNPTATFAQMIGNIKHGFHEAVLLMGVGSAYYGLGAEPRALSWVHLIAILVVIAAVAGAGLALVWGVVRGRPSSVGASSEGSWRLDDMLLFGVLGSAAAFDVLAESYNAGYARYLTAAIIFGAVLAGRVVGGTIQHLRWRPLSRVAAAVGVAAIACYAAGVAFNIDRPEPVARSISLAGFLESHHLENGIGPYWSASVVTVASGGRVEVRPVVSDDGKLVRYHRCTAAFWYTKPFRFLVFNLRAPWGGVVWPTAVNTFGPPSKAYTVDETYRVMVWDRPITVPPQSS